VINQYQVIVKKKNQYQVFILSKNYSEKISFDSDEIPTVFSLRGNLNYLIIPKLPLIICITW